MKKQYSAEQIVAMRRQADVGLGKGLRVPEVCKQLGFPIAGWLGSIDTAERRYSPKTTLGTR